MKYMEPKENNVTGIMPLPGRLKGCQQFANIGTNVISH